jgi:hypothetical protein
MSKEHWRRYLEALGGEWEDLMGRHLDEEELVAYGRGQLEDVEAERLQSHLLRCDRCLTAFKDVVDFFGELREGEEPVGEREIRREWDVFRRRVHAPAVARKSFGLWIGPRAIFALAASVLVAVGLATFWGLRLRQDVQQMARQWQAEHARREAAEQHARRLQQQNDALARAYESELAELRSQLAELRQPQWNVPVYDIFSREALLRSGSASGINDITVPRSVRSFSLTMSGTGHPEYPSYAIELVDGRGHLRWRATGVQRDRYGNFTLTLDRAFLDPGEYWLRLHGQKDGRLQKLAEYRIRLRYR